MNAPTPEPPRNAAADNVWTDAQWDALSSPHRVQLLGLVESLQRTCIRELSELTGRTGPSLYPHLRILENALFVKVETERHNGRTRRVYCAGPALGWNVTEHGRPDTRGRAVKLAGYWLRDLGIRLKRWGQVREGGPAVHGERATGMMISETTWLDDDQRQELNRRLGEVVEFIRRTQKERRGKRHNISIYHFPDVTLRDVRERRRGSRQRNRRA